MALVSTSFIVGMFIPYARIFSNFMAKMKNGKENYIIKKINTTNFQKIKKIIHNRDIGMVVVINKFYRENVYTLCKDDVEFYNRVMDE